MCREFLDCGMPKRKASKARKEASKKAHEARGSGSKSRISLDFEKLKNAGWTIEERPSSSSRASLQFSYRNPEGIQYNREPKPGAKPSVPTVE